MIYEVRTYTVKPTTLPEVVRIFGDAYEHRKKYSELAAFFTTEIGPLNQIIHIWPYADLEERGRVRAESRNDPNWPPKMHEYLVKMESEIYNPFPFSPELKPGNFGPYYEMRTYTVAPGGGLAAIGERWEKQLPKRTALSPLSVVMFTEFGGLNKYMHIWPYKSLDQRAEIRKTAVETKAWPAPGGAGIILSQENKIVVPAPFSPMQ